MVVGDKASFPGLSFGRGGQRSTGSSKESGVKSFMSGIVSPFTACWQPSISSCVPGCTIPPDYRFGKPSVVSPLVDRLGPHHHESVSPRSKSSHNYHPSSPHYQPSSGPPLPKVSDQPEPATDIEKPHSTDVLCGRGGSSNRHLGNMHFRELVAANKKTYVALTKKQKMMVARSIVEMVRSTEPPGRFLAKDLDTGLWYDIGVPRSLEKTSQALREKNSNDFPQEANETASDVSGSTPPRSDSGVSSPVSVDEPSTKNSRSSKNVEAPPLTIPPHLMEVFGPKKPQETHRHSWPDYPPPSRHIDQPYLHSYPHPPPSSPPRDPYRVPPRPHTHHYAATPPRTPSHHYGTPPPYSHSEPPHYGKSPPYGHHESPQDYREHYDHYPRRSDHHDHYASHSQQRMSSQSGRLPPSPAPPEHYHSYPPPPPPPLPPHHPHRYHRPQRRPQSQPPHPSHGAPLTPVSRQTPPPYDHYSFGHPSTPPMPMPPAPSSSSTLIFRTHSNGYVRGKAEVSPERRQEWKRQRNDKGVTRRLSETSLSNAIENSLTLEERVVGRERHSRELTSPSGVLQSRSRRTLQPKAEKDDGIVDRLSGLAALSTAAFLKLEEA